MCRKGWNWAATTIDNCVGKAATSAQVQINDMGCVDIARTVLNFVTIKNA